MCFMQIESVLQTKNRSKPAKIWFSVALLVSSLGHGVIETTFLRCHLRGNP